jgi:methionine synthase II (cobalamin-independent)
MFATVSGGLPRPPSPASGGIEEGDPDVRRALDDELVREVIAFQEAAGLEALSDGRVRFDDPFAWPATDADRARWPARRAVEVWRFASACTSAAVKQAVPGPFSLGRRLTLDRGRRRRTLELAEALNEEIHALAAAGCPLVEIEEADAAVIDGDAGERRLFRDAHRRLTDGVDGVHLSLAIVGPSSDTAGAETIFDAPYASYLFDLIAGPDDWRLVTKAPADRGIVCGAMSAEANGDEGAELLVWAAHYAASSGGRGLDRVGLANAAGFERLPWDIAARKIRRLGEAARIAALPRTGELARALDPRAVSSRSAALGRYVPRPHRART